MSLVAEVVLQKELDYFKKNEQNCYQQFIKTTSLLLATKYPVLDKTLKRIVNNYLKHIQNIFSNFSKDITLILKSFSIKENKNIIIKDIDTSLGDGHSGESTALVTLSNGTKLIYKPRNIDVGNSYNLFVNWVNQKLDTNLKTIKCVSNGNYGWLEFVIYEAVNTPDELQEYYYKAGILLAVTLLLGSKDCHLENIIASGKDPVIIDHETIIQPVLSNQSIRTWDNQHKIPHFSVLESMLIANSDTGVPIECSGYGIKGNVEAMNIESQVINPNTIDSKRTSRFIYRKQVKENIPLYKNTHVFANNYKSHFVKGFTYAYDMFIASKEELKSCNSPINFFKNQKIRYVWRPTFVYFRILKYMRGVSFMSSFESYNSKLYELMSKAYQKENSNNYEFILDYEVKQMLKGDIPLFDLDSMDYHLGENKSFKIFKYNCIENIKDRIDSLSIHHKEKQLEYIERWLQIGISKKDIATEVQLNA
jgi:type 2 lantibiotic biosynthesis protein LanM